MLLSVSLRVAGLDACPAALTATRRRQRTGPLAAQLAPAITFALDHCGSMAGLEDCLGAARAALDGFELQALPLAAIAGALLLALLIRALLAQRVPSITVEPVTGAAQGPPPAPCCRALCAQQCDAPQGGRCTVAAVWGLERRRWVAAAVAGRLGACWRRHLPLKHAVPLLPVPCPSSGEAAPASPARRSTRKAAMGGDATTIPCYDPGTQELLGYVPAMSADEVGQGWAGSCLRSGAFMCTHQTAAGTATVVPSLSGGCASSGLALLPNCCFVHVLRSWQPLHVWSLAKRLAMPLLG